MGSLLIALVICVLLFDSAPWYPFLLSLAILLAAVGSIELYQLIGAAHGLPLWLSGGSVLMVLLANWPAHLWPDRFGSDPWRLVLAVFTAVVLLGFLVEMAAFRPPSQTAETSPPILGGDKGGAGHVVIRLALLVWTTAYLGLLPSFLMQLRWFPPSPPKDWGGGGGGRSPWGFSFLSAVILARTSPGGC